MKKNKYLTLFCFLLALSYVEAEEALVDSQTIPQALALFIAGNVNGCEVLISSSVPSESWASPTGLLLRAKNLIYLGVYAKEQNQILVAQAIGGTVTQRLDAAVAVLPENDTEIAVLQLTLRASVEEELLGNTKQAELLKEQALALAPPAAEPLSPPEE